MYYLYSIWSSCIQYKVNAESNSRGLFQRAIYRLAWKDLGQPQEVGVIDVPFKIRKVYHLTARYHYYNLLGHVILNTEISKTWQEINYKFWKGKHTTARHIILLAVQCVLFRDP